MPYGEGEAAAGSVHVPEPVPEAELAAERDWLRHAQDCLRHMYDATRQLTPHAASELATRALEYTLAKRLASLRLDPGTPLFFGRLDYGPGDGPHAGERHYVGRRHVRDPEGEPVVLDWRAALCEDFYQASPGDPRGLTNRRRHGFAAGVLTGYEDDPVSSATPAGLSDLVIAEIERPRVGAMSDIVATIQPDQDHVVRAGLRTTICIQGGPGTGKTAVGLHRAAFLLYRDAEQLSRGKVLILGPNELFLDYIGQVLPALGEIEVEHRTLAGLLTQVPVRAKDPDDVSAIKGDARMAQVLAAALDAGRAAPAESLVVNVAGRSWRLPLDELAKIVEDVRARGLRYEPARHALAGMVGLALARRIGFDESAPSDRSVERLARAKEVTAWVRSVAPPVDPVRLVARLLADRDFLAACAGDLLSAEEQSAIVWPRPPRSAAAARWTFADAVLVDEAAGLLDRPRTYGHVIVDEAQDMSAMQCRAVGRRCATSSATLLGDFAQATTSHALTSWAETLRHLGKTDGVLEVLTVSYRVPGRILEYANRLLPHLEADVAPVTAARRGSGVVREISCAQGELALRTAELVREAARRPGTVGVIVPDALADEMSELVRAEGPGRVSLVPVTAVKGLEFDTAIVVEPALIAGAEAYGLRRLYVALTRAVSELAVIHTMPLPPAPAR